MNKKQNTSDATLINKPAIAMGFTQSEMTTMDACPEKWYRAYNQMLRKKGQLQWWSVYGTGVHSTLESFYSRLDGNYELATLQIPDDVFLTAQQEQELKYYTQLLDIQMERYCTYYADDINDLTIHANEEILTVVHEGVKFTGKIDLEIDDGKGMHGPMDHKTTALVTPEIIQGWNFRFQFLFYAWMLWKDRKVKPNALWWNSMKKPQLRQKQNESFESFMVRVRADMINEPDKYFKRQMLPLDDGILEHFEKRTLGPKLSRLRLLTDATTSGIMIESMVRNQNTSECVRFGKPCEFLELCKSGWALEGHAYTRRETKHEELEIE